MEQLIKKIQIKMRFLREETGLFRKYYRGVENKNLYCDQDGEWFICTEDGEPCCPLRDDVEPVII